MFGKTLNRKVIFFNKRFLRYNCIQFFCFLLSFSLYLRKRIFWLVTRDKTTFILVYVSMVSEENLNQQHESKGYWIVMWVIAFVFLVLVRYALTKVATRVQYAKDNMRIRLKPVLLWWCILLVLFFVMLFLLNRRAKKKQWDEKKSQHKDQSA